MSAEANYEQIDMKGVGHVSVDSCVPGDAELGALADAAVLRDTDEMDTARARGAGALGAPAAVRALAVTGNFEMMNRLLDATGVGPTKGSHEIGAAIGVPPPPRWL